MLFDNFSTFFSKVNPDCLWFCVIVTYGLGEFYGNIVLSEYQNINIAKVQKNKCFMNSYSLAKL